VSRAITKLPKKIVTPALDSAVCSQRACVAPAGRKGGHSTRKPHDIHRRVALHGRAVTQLTETVATPTPCDANHSQGAGMRTTRCNGHHTASHIDDVYRRAAMDCRAIAELTNEINAPALESTNRSQGAGMPLTSDDSQDASI
jgi:hypothetical protein